MSQVNHNPSGTAQAYWRNLEELADTPEVRSLLETEFPGYDASTMATSSRRRFMKLMGASMALAGITLTGCRRWPEEKLAPYTAAPKNHIPGVPEQYATNWELGGVAQGLLATSFDGRPIKIEGNPTHPMAWTIKGKQGSADAYAQASVLELYDPQRSRVVLQRIGGEARESDWGKFGEEAMVRFAAGKGDKVAVLSEAMGGPTALDLKQRFLKAFPQAKWYEYEPLSRDSEREGAKLAFGKALRPVLHLEKADVAVFLDEDPLFTHPTHVRYAADWSERRRSVDGKAREMNRVYLAESRFSVTGTVADARLPADPGRIAVAARVLATRLGVAGVAGDDKLTAAESVWVDAAAKDLKRAGKAGVVAAGEAMPPEVHALAHAINQHLGAVGNTVTLIDDASGDRPAHFAAIKQVADDLRSGAITTLLILGGNPAYDAPADVEFGPALAKATTTVHLSLYDNETSRLCKWHLPRAHYLEAWGDARAWDGSVGLTQPLIEPLFGGKSVIELLALLTRDQVQSGEQLVRRTWAEQVIKQKGAAFETVFRKALELGVLEGSAPAGATAQLTAKSFEAPKDLPGNALYVRFEQDSRVYDGRFANNGWLQETHDPLTKLVWDNAALISKKDADQWGVTTGDVVRIDANGRSMEAAAYVLPGQPIGVVGISLGYGRKAAGKIGDGLGFNAYAVRTAGAPWTAANAKVSKTGHNYTLALTHLHHLIDKVGMEGRKDRVGGKGQTGVIVREAALAEFAKNPQSPHSQSHGHLSLQLFNPPSQFNTPHAWGMAVDLNTCIGCNACVVACQAENNIPVVGKEQVLKHREMHWIRIDRYFKGDADDPQIDVVHQPMMCVHCENAPCEQVCPVAATVHDTEGLNTMVYNRCIGTRYCSNNCPYKVRRFNYFDFHSKPPREPTASPWNNLPDTQQQAGVDRIKRMVFNPDVTVRMRGVMEKCTYCTQRLQNAKIAARNQAFKDGKPGEGTIEDGTLMTACQQACPTQAIVFGDLNDPNSHVRALQKVDRAYDVLGELNTRPRTRFLAKIRNPAEAGAGGSPAPRPAEHHG